MFKFEYMRFVGPPVKKIDDIPMITVNNIICGLAWAFVNLKTESSQSASTEQLLFDLTVEPRTQIYICINICILAPHPLIAPSHHVTQKKSNHSKQYYHSHHTHRTHMCTTYLYCHNIRVQVSGYLPMFNPKLFFIVARQSWDRVPLVYRPCNRP